MKHLSLEDSIVAEFEEIWPKDQLITEEPFAGNQWEMRKKWLKTALTTYKSALLGEIEGKLPKAMDEEHSYYERNRDFDLGLEKMTSKFRQILSDLRT